MSRPKAGEPYAFKTPEGVLYWHPPARRGAGGGEGPGYHMEPCTTNEGMVWLGTGSHRFLAPVGLLRAVVADLDGDAIATLTRERDELERLCAQLQAKANEVPGLSAALDEARGPVRLAQPGDLVSAVAWVEAPEPAPEVVDVPQPVVKCSDAGWRELIAVLEADRQPDGAAVDYVRALITRLRAAEARIERVGAILSDEGCDCYCDCDSDGHNADCDLCLACRIDREVSP